MNVKSGNRKSLPRQRQQGDVILDLVPLPKRAKKKDGRIILAVGEATGHLHEVIGHGLTCYEDEAGVLYVVADQEGTLTHQEHHAQPIPVTPPGMAWRRRTVQEYDHFAEEARRVAD
jgi:hypothetical protein